MLYIPFDNNNRKPKYYDELCLELGFNSSPVLDDEEDEPTTVICEYERLGHRNKKYTQSFYNELYEHSINDIIVLYLCFT